MCVCVCTRTRVRIRIPRLVPGLPAVPVPSAAPGASFLDPVLGLCSFSEAAIINYPKCSGSNQQEFILSQTGSQKSKAKESAGPGSLRVVWERGRLPLPGAQAPGARRPGQHHSDLCPHLLRAFPSSVQCPTSLSSQDLSLDLEPLWII